MLELCRLLDRTQVEEILYELRSGCMSIGMRCGIGSESVKWLRGCEYGIVVSCVSLFLSKVSVLERKIYFICFYF